MPPSELLVAPWGPQEQWQGMSKGASLRPLPALGKRGPHHQPHPPGNKGHLGEDKREPSWCHLSTQLLPTYVPMKPREEGIQDGEVLISRETPTDTVMGPWLMPV